MADPVPSDRQPITALVTTFNEHDHIAACLDTLLWADEILVVDSFSNDGTVEIVAGYGARHGGVRLVQRTYHGAAAQKNWALLHEVQNEWVLIFDADERCTPALRREIETLLAGPPDRNGYVIHRRVFFLGQRIRFSGWQNDQVIRLIRRGKAWYPNRRVHADMVVEGGVRRLRASMDHYMVDDFHEYLLRILKYSRWGAAQAWRDGRRAGVAELLGRPLWRFLRTYFIQRGIFDGVRGLVFCLLQAFGTYAKWSTLWGFRRNEQRGIEPDLPSFDDGDEVWQGLEALQAGEAGSETR